MIRKLSVLALFINTIFKTLQVSRQIQTALNERGMNLRTWLARKLWESIQWRTALQHRRQMAAFWGWELETQENWTLESTARGLGTERHTISWPRDVSKLWCANTAPLMVARTSGIISMRMTSPLTDLSGLAWILMVSWQPHQVPAIIANSDQMVSENAGLSCLEMSGSQRNYAGRQN